MAKRTSSRRVSDNRLTFVFLVVLLPPAATLIGLGLRLLAVDRSLEIQREREGREQAAAGMVASLAQSLTELETRLAAGEWPEGVLRISASATGVQAEPARRLLWTPQQPDLPEAASTPFFEPEKAEYRGQVEVALRAYRELARSSSPTMRVGALLRVARVQRTRRRIDEALAAYKALLAIRGVAFDGGPVDLLARREICRLLRDAGRMDAFRSSAASLESDFLENHWTLDRVTWELAARDIEQMTGRPLGLSVERKALTASADWVWRNARDHPQASALRTAVLDTIPVTLLWRAAAPQAESSSLEVIAVGPSIINGWLKRASQAAPVTAGHMSLLSESGALVAGDAPDNGEAGRSPVTRSPKDTTLPWTVVLTATDASRAAARFDGRRQLLGLGLAAIVLLLGGGGYVLWRVTQRELAVARLQTDFVATVSHEFRTPLTSLQHITELLQEDDELEDSAAGRKQRHTFYGALARNTERLHRLVESLLDFSRMESGRKPWRQESMDAGVFAGEVAAEFQREVERQGFRIDVAVEGPGAHLVKADTEALGHALWNLLDNAVKYSQERKTVRVSVGRNPHGVVIAVEDEGIGIPAREQRHIFRKFVRGDSANDLGIKGTGLGLAIVSHIVEGHGGVVELESAEGKGSTFRMVLPAEG